MKNKLFTRIFISSLVITLLITIMVQMLIIVLAPDMVNEGDSISEMVIVEDHNPEVTEEISDAEEIHYVDVENTSQYIAVIIRRTLPYSLLLSVGVSLIFSFVFSRRISDPIVRMAKVTSDMAGMRPGAKSEEKYCEEISLLSDNINQMYAALCENIDSLEKEKNKVIEAEKMKLDFLRAASHELKTPVTSVNIILENMILKIGKYRDYDTYLPKCRSIVENLGEMINEILLTSRLGYTAADDIRIIDFDLSESIRKQVEDHKVIAESGNITVALDLQKVEIHTDKYLFEKALSNIIGNAVRYTNENGRAIIMLEKEKLTVFNECTPLADEELQHIFEPYYRPDYARSKDLGGSGLGLYTTGLILERLGFPYKFVPDPKLKGMSFIIDLER